MVKIAALLLLLLSYTAHAWVAAPLVTSSRGLSSMQLNAEEKTGDPFDDYSVDDPLQLTVATKDTVVGDGDVAMIGKVLTVAYKGRLLSTGRNFDSGTGYSFRLGDGKVIPGWEQGLVGMKVGGTRILRVPPNLAYGDRGAKDKIPPGSHLEFDCELKAVAANQMEETLNQINIQPERIITFVLLCILLIAGNFDSRF